MRIAQTEVYTFAELSAKAQKIAIAAEQQAQAELFEFETDDIKMETLRHIIDTHTLTKEHVLALAALVGKGCRQRNKEKLKYCWPSGHEWWHERVTFNTNGAHYCAGQDYPAEIARIRKSLLS